ncbi:hypothetical protein FACS1894147_02190 [Spirochaetia bacterium]|nr:hypothetical protein FACS1894147_02190 [Spirochaetia bacterium]
MKQNDTLTLKQFITSTLVDINVGINEARNQGVLIAAATNNKDLPACKSVEFDIAVQITQSETSENKKSGGLDISVLNFKLGKNKSGETENLLTNRIRFSVDAFLGVSDQGAV